MINIKYVHTGKGRCCNMYKSRFKFWIIVGIIWVIMINFYPTIKEHIKEYFSRPYSVTFSSEDNIVKRRLNGINITLLTKINVTQKDADIILSKGIASTDGYVHEQLYSPIVAYINTTYYDPVFQKINGTKNNSIRALNVNELINGFLEDMTFKNFYTMSGKGNIKNEVPLVCVDTSLENEIKTVMIMALAQKTHITPDDVAEWEGVVNKVWEKAEKVEDANTFMQNEIDSKTPKILFTAEYKKPLNSNIRQLTLTNTVAIEYTLEYKEDVSFAYNDNIMSKTGLRSAKKPNFYNGEILKYADYTVSYKTDTELHDILSLFDRGEINKEEKTDIHANAETQINVSQEQKEGNTSIFEESEGQGDNSKINGADIIFLVILCIFCISVLHLLSILLCPSM